MTGSDSEETRASRVFAACADSRRRTALRCLRERGGIALSGLAERVARREAGADEPVGDERVHRVYASLYHTHVPKLERAGLVSYRPDEEHVTLEADATDTVRDAVAELRGLLR